MRAFHPSAQDDLSDADLDRLYAFDEPQAVRMVAVQTLDGAASGSDGKSGSIGNTADQRVYDANRRACDAVVVGASTAEAEGYRPLRPDAARPKVLVVLSTRCQLPKQLALNPGEPGCTIMITGQEANESELEKTRERLGSSHVLVLPDAEPEPPQIVAALHERGLHHLLCEGGPRIFGTWLAAGVITELALTHTPLMIGADSPRVTSAPPFESSFALRHVLEEHGTLLTRWSRSD